MHLVQTRRHCKRHIQGAKVAASLHIVHIDVVIVSTNLCKLKYLAVPARSIRDKAREGAAWDLTIRTCGLERTRRRMPEVQAQNLTKLAMSTNLTMLRRISFGRCSRPLLEEAVRAVSVDKLGRDCKKAIRGSCSRGHKRSLEPDRGLPWLASSPLIRPNSSWQQLLQRFVSYVGMEPPY